LVAINPFFVMAKPAPKLERSPSRPMTEMTTIESRTLAFRSATDISPEEGADVLVAESCLTGADLCAVTGSLARVFTGDDSANT
jgi:hypothetical protein